MDDLVTRLVVVAFYSGIGTLAICLFCNIFILPFTKVKDMEKAKKDGRVVTARLVSMVHPNTNGYDDFDAGGRLAIQGKYQYVYKGRLYKYSGLFDGVPPREIQLYFRKNPKKARTAQHFARVESEWKPLFVVLTAIGYVVTFFFF